MSATAMPRASAGSVSRERWRTSVEARALIMCTAALLAFGLATLYSASAMVAMPSSTDMRSSNPSGSPDNS